MESIDSTIDRLKKEIRFYNRVIGIGNIIKIVLSASIPILIDQASEHRSLLLIVSIASAIITIIQSGMSAFNYQDKVQTSKSSPDSCVKCYTMFLPFLLIKIDVFS
ncbi:DUF4231 domain-containing protein, partial [Enterococcus faecium]